MTETDRKENVYSMVTPEIRHLASQVQKADHISTELYAQYNVKRGLRDINGRGVLAGLTNVSEVRALKVEEGQEYPDEGSLFYRGYNIYDLIKGFQSENRFGYEEVAYLLLFGSLPSKDELDTFSNQLDFYRCLPKHFVRDVVLKASDQDIMNGLMRGILTLYPYDDKANDVSLPNVLRQSIQLISEIPMISIYEYQAYQHYMLGDSLIVHHPLKTGSMAENILYLLRTDHNYTDLEAKVLDAALVLHMDHSGGNNSTFTTHVVTSSHTDTYSSVVASLASLKGPRHGGANIKVVEMFEDLKQNVDDLKDEEKIERYLRKVLSGEAFDHAGLIYGIGHAVYSKSDPRAVIFRQYVQMLAEQSGNQREFELYELVARKALNLIENERKIYKGVCVNVDYYSGLAYSMLGLPKELYTPIFAMGRIVGWSAHRMEELANNGKIIRPAYKSVAEEREYCKLGDR